MSIAIGCTPRFDVTLSRALVDVLTKLGSTHYDGVCKSAVRAGGFIYGWSNALAFAIELNGTAPVVSIDNHKLQTALKILEGGLPHILSSEELAACREFVSIGFAALRQANRDERFGFTVDVVSTIGIRAPSPTKPQPILPRLDASHCELCKEAAEFIRQMRKTYEQDMREAECGAREAYTEGNYDGRQEAGDRW